MNGQMNYMFLQLLFGKYAELDLYVFCALRVRVLYFSLVIFLPDIRTAFVTQALGKKFSNVPRGTHLPLRLVVLIVL